MSFIFEDYKWHCLVVFILIIISSMANSNSSIVFVQRSSMIILHLLSVQQILISVTF